MTLDELLRSVGGDVVRVASKDGDLSRSATPRVIE
jgi:hypothetical protein